MFNLSTNVKHFADKFDLSIIIVNYNTPELTNNCIESIKKYTKGISKACPSGIKYEIVLIDNSIKNRGFTGGNNVGMKKAKGRYVLLLNSDTVIHDNVLGEMVAWMDENPKIGIATCALKNKDGSLQSTGGYFPTLTRVFSWMTIQDLPLVDTIIKPFHPKIAFYNSTKYVDWVTGAFMLIRREVIEKIGYLDPEYFMYTEDTDFCFRAKKAGFKVLYNPKWSITHFGGASSTKEFPLLSEFKNVKLFYKKHYPNWQYLPLRLLLKLGSTWRMILINREIYAKAFREA